MSQEKEWIEVEIRWWKAYCEAARDIAEINDTLKGAVEWYIPTGQILGIPPRGRWRANERRTC